MNNQEFYGIYINKKIPMLKDFNSLNVSNAAAIILFEAVKQQVKTDKR